MSTTSNTSESIENIGGEKSKNHLKNELKKAEKLKKYEAKLAKVGDLAEKAKPKAEKARATYAASDSPSTTSVSVSSREKKDMSQPMAAAYSPAQVESGWYGWWEASGFFKPEYRPPAESTDPKKREKFVMVLPPPNVTGSLHLGHAMMGSIEDALSRWNRMCGREVLFLPGCDHAGIATQAVVEKKLKKERGLTRHDLGRDAFLAEVWAYKEQFGGRIYEQLRRLGLSVDWERARFTLDPPISQAVLEAFVRMFDAGLIFRANRLVNWSAKLQTALSDLEVDSVEIAGESWLPVSESRKLHRKDRYLFGVMTSLAYRLIDGAEGEEIVVATTRPETVFADVAVAVNPTDDRYKRFHGRSVAHPITGRAIPVVVDEVADAAFGTGALKITPSHDHTDFAVAQRRGLPVPPSILDHENVLCQSHLADGTPLVPADFLGMARFDAREAVIEAAKRLGTFRGSAPHAMSLPVCSRSGDFVEPRLMPQWWCSCREMADKAIEAVRSGRIAIAPREYERTWFAWLQDIRDWCLSRQLWWGHRVPAYEIGGFPAAASLPDAKRWVVGRDAEEAMRRAVERFPEHAGTLTLSQDPDVLDTWFSSGLWPFVTMGWPAESSDMANFFPTTLLETGGDILFFWVARMVMMSEFLTGREPFSRIFLHAIVRDAHGRKMSKSLGNVIDPVDVIQGVSLEALQETLLKGNLDAAEVEKAKAGQRRDFPRGIPECGTDALRFALCSYVAQGRDVNLNINKVESFRKFCNKLWNACRFALQKLGDDFVPAESFAMSSECDADHWIVSRLSAAAAQANENFEVANLMNATSAIHAFWLYDLCDVYIEAAKPILAGPGAEPTKHVLYYCLEQGLRLLHPFMPYVTEELYQRLPRRPRDNCPSICVSAYPKLIAKWNAEKAAAFDRLNGIARALRSTATELRDSGKVSTGTLVLSLYAPEAALAEAGRDAQLAALVRAVGSLSICEERLPEMLPLALEKDAETSASSGFYFSIVSK